MPYFLWNNDKNRKLKSERGIGFEDVVYYIESGGLIDEVDHPNQQKYPGQELMYVDIGNYVHIVPFVESEDGYFLKTIIPSRKATRDFFGERDE